MNNDWRDVPKPPALAARPHDNRGFPITFVTLIGPDGRPDFTTIDSAKIIASIEGALCGMCGESLIPTGPEVAFIGGPLSIEHRNFLDPPMHVDCAQYAMQVCPHIATPTSRYAKPKEDPGVQRELATDVHPDRPERFGMLIASIGHISLTHTAQGQPVFLAPAAPVQIFWQEDLKETA